MSIITLTTDYGHKDYFVGALKGKIYSEFTEAKIVDISHGIFPFNLSETSYLVGAACKNFPDGTVHIIGVDIEKNERNNHVAILWNNQYFIAADNGILSLMTHKLIPQKIFEINIYNQLKTNSTDIDAFVKVACHLANNGKLEEIGFQIDSLKQITDFQALISEDNKIIKGMIIYIDNYGNAVCNITREMFYFYEKERSFQINFKNTNLKTIFARYSVLLIGKKEKPSTYDGQKLAVFNDAGFLEIGLYRSSPTAGSAKTMFGFVIGDFVTINFL